MGLDLSGKVAIVTGAGRDRGIGRAAAVRLARAGAAVVATDAVGAGEGADDRMAGIERTAELCRSAGGDATALAVDVTDRGQVEACIEAATERFGGVHVVFNNAGTPVGAGSVLDIPDEHWDLSWRINVLGMVSMIRLVAEPMRAAGGGSIVNNASIAGLGAIAGLAAYTTTKFAVIGLTKSAAADLGPLGIRVNAICPGMISTQMGDVEIDHWVAEWGVSTEESAARMAELAALGRWGTPEEVADAVAWLAGDSSRYVTGVALPVAGGTAPGL